MRIDLLGKTENQNLELAALLAIACVATAIVLSVAWLIVESTMQPRQPNLFHPTNEQWWVDEDTLCETRVSPSDPEFRELLCVWMKEDEE